MKVAVERALISVSDKSGLVEFAERLVASGVEIVSSGGTAAALHSAGIAVTAVSEVTGAPEMLGGRVKTLHPRIHGGILADRSQPDHDEDLAVHDISPFELVVVNLYPFEATVADPTVDLSAAIEQIDIGGPTLIRAAAKNHAWVGVVTSPSQYDLVADAVESGGLPGDLRAQLAKAAFYSTAAYDAAILRWLDRADEMPDRLVVAFEKVDTLRYGENPSQAAALYTERAGDSWWRDATQLQGMAMSFNNYADTEAAWRLVNDLENVAIAIIKHTNAAGVAVRSSPAEAFSAAWDGDPLAAFGSVVAGNAEVDEATASLIAKQFVEVVIAPSYSDAAASILAAKDNLRVIAASPPGRSDLDLRRIERGVLTQQREPRPVPEGQVWDESWSVVSARKPTSEERADLAFAWTVAAHTKSNSIVVARHEAAVGVGAGDQSRVGAAQRAVQKARERAVGAVAASDAFFPFRDGVDALARAGITAIIEPGGSRRDDEVIAAADEFDVALIFTNRRYFKH